MKIFKKIFRLLPAALICMTAFLSACNYTEDYGYTAIDPGTLPGPSVSRESANYREVYPTLEKYASPVKLKLAGISYDLEPNVKPGTTLMNQSFVKIAKDVLNIELEFSISANSTAYDNKINLSIASGVMPDMFYTTAPSLFAQLRDEGALADLSGSFWNLNDELLENYLTYMPELLPTVMKDSKLYALPMLVNKYAAAQKLYIRRDWLDTAGVAAPKTVEDFIAVGEKFVEKKNEIASATGVEARRLIPFTMHKEITWAGSFSGEGLFNAHGASIGAYFENADGKLHASAVSNEAKAALNTLNTMYKKDILDKEFLTKTSEQIQANIKAGYVGMVFGEWWLPKDALDACISNVPGSDWVWVDLPAFGEEESKPIVSRVNIAGYNLVSSKCSNPEAAVKLINLFYDIYYSDDAQARYGDGVLPSNGFYYQYVPIKLWDGVASIKEYKRVQEVFSELYDAGFYKDARLDSGMTEQVAAASVTAADYQISASGTTATIIKRSVVNEINANDVYLGIFNKLRLREKTLHFASGYPYFAAYKKGINVTAMTAAEKAGWGIYHQMIDENGSYAYVTALAEGAKESKYNEFYGPALTTMTTYGDYLNTQTNKIFTQIITNEKEVSYFDTFVNTVYNANGGDKINSQINAWYDAQPKS